MYHDSSKFRVTGLLSRVTASKTSWATSLSPCPSHRRAFSFRPRYFLWPQSFHLHLWTFCSKDELLRHPFLMYCSVHNARLQCVDMSSSKADAVTTAFGSLLLSPVETLDDCALPLSDQGLLVLLFQVCAITGGRLHLRVLGSMACLSSLTAIVLFTCQHLLHLLPLVSSVTPKQGSRHVEVFSHIPAWEIYIHVHLP